MRTGPTVNQDSIDNRLTKSITIILVNEMNLGLGLGDQSGSFQEFRIGCWY